MTPPASPPQTLSRPSSTPDPALSACATRDRALRIWYAKAALARIPRLLSAIDRNPHHATYGCFDRQYWHYRTAAFPSEMYQEGVLALALVYATPLPGNRWFRESRIRQLAIAALRYSARSGHADGSCDDYYPFERALGAAVFSLQAAARAYEVLELDDAKLLRGFEHRARWIASHEESGRLSNHHALAALALVRTARATGRFEFHEAADEQLQRLLTWQSPEGWFEEYGGADPGYQTVTIDCLAKYRQLTGVAWLEEPLHRAVEFARLFLHPDGGYGGEYGSRGTYHFYPHGMELLAAEHAGAADLADAFLQNLAEGREASFDDDRLIAHRTANLIESYVDWSSERAPNATPSEAGTAGDRYLPGCQILMARRGPSQTIVSAARGGVFKHFSASEPTRTDCGLVVEFADGRVAVSQQHDLAHEVEWHEDGGLDVRRQLVWQRHETASPLKQAMFHVGMVYFGRWCRGLIRRLLQRRLITGRRTCGVRLTRQFELPAPSSRADASLRVTDTIELIDRQLVVRRMHFSSDLQSAYVAATNVYHDDVLCPATDLADHVDELNHARRVTITREFS